MTTLYNTGPLSRPVGLDQYPTTPSQLPGYPVSARVPLAMNPVTPAYLPGAPVSGRVPLDQNPTMPYTMPTYGGGLQGIGRPVAPPAVPRDPGGYVAPPQGVRPVTPARPFPIIGQGRTLPGNIPGRQLSPAPIPLDQGPKSLGALNPGARRNTNVGLYPVGADGATAATNGSLGPQMSGNTPAVPTDASGNSFAPINTVQDMLAQFTDPNSAYMKQVAQQAAQQANARGALNSSIAAGNAQAEAIRAAQPFVQQAMGLQMQRESQAFQGGQAQLQREFQRQNIYDQAGLENWLAQNNIERQDWINASDAQRADWLRGNDATRQDWLANQSWTRDFNGALSLMPINSSNQMLQAIMQAGMANPQVFTPSVISGLSNFFGQNWLSTMQGLFPNAFGSNP